jgi:hypothetical protein
VGDGHPPFSLVCSMVFNLCAIEFLKEKIEKGRNIIKAQRFAGLFSCTFDFPHLLSYNASTAYGERNLHSLSGSRSENSRNAH